MGATRIRWTSAAKAAGGIAAGGALLLGVAALSEPGEAEPLPPDVGLATGATGAYGALPELPPAAADRALRPGPGRPSAQREPIARPERTGRDPGRDASPPDRRHERTTTATASQSPAPAAPIGPAPTPSPAPAPVTPSPAPSPAPPASADVESKPRPQPSGPPPAAAQFGFER